MVMVTQPCEILKTVYFQRINFMVYKLYLIFEKYNKESSKENISWDSSLPIKEMHVRY